ncbi:MAG TPA: hypothetical protein VII67_08995 [Acidimicrobiales bacterium]
MRYRGHLLGSSPELQPLQITTPLELVTLKKGDIPPISTLHVELDVLRSEAVILTTLPGPYRGKSVEAVSRIADAVHKDDDALRADTFGVKPCAVATPLDMPRSTRLNATPPSA